jgi:hypothetical protein
MAQAISRPTSGSAKKQKNPGPALKPISEQMREWSAMLRSEMEGWPRVSAKKMFGFISLYRGKQIFAALPYTRTPSVRDSFMFKFERPSARVLEKLQADKRIISEQGIGTRWFIFKMSSSQDLHAAVEWLAHAYEAAKTRR